jgi:hypothetical protein
MNETRIRVSWPISFLFLRSYLKKKLVDNKYKIVTDKTHLQ